MRFRKLRGVNVPYREQGLIHFTCVNYEKQPKEVQEKIRALCREIGGPDYEEALFAMMTRENVSADWIEQNYYVSDSWMYKKRVMFYEQWKRYDQNLQVLRGKSGGETEKTEALQQGVLEESG